MIKGIIVFKLSNVGSKSENMDPYLYQGKGVYIKIRLKEANPFMPSKLNEYDGKEVELEGEFNDNEVFIIENIK